MSTINILCLHGSSQHPDAFASYLSSVTKMSKKAQFASPKLEFHFIAAPFQHPLGGLTWTDPPLNVEDIWHDIGSTSRDNALIAVPKLQKDDSLLEKTFELMKESIDKFQVTVLLGFSQGSFAIYEYMRKFRDPRIIRIVTMSGYTFDNLNSEEPPLDCPILNVVNPMDSIVPASLAYTNSKQVYRLEHNNKNFDKPCREAHVTPTRANDTRAICQFIQTGVFNLTTE